jgi:NitT/TauT family transport system permease protein/taurine transport system permease protein
MSSIEALGYHRFRWRKFAVDGAGKLLILLVAVLILWSLVSSLIGNPDRYLPSPESTAQASIDLLYKGVLPSFFADTLTRLVIGSLIGIAIGIPVGLLLGLNRTVSDMFYPIVNFFQSVSGIAILPVVIIWFGNSDLTVLIIILYTSFFPITFNVLSGVRAVPIRYVHAVRTLGGSHLQVVRDVLLPGAMPSIAVGSRLSIGFAWRAVIAGEMLAGRPGLGSMIFAGQQLDNTAQIVLGMMIIGFTWIVLDHFLLRPLETDTIERWGLVQR